MLKFLKNLKEKEADLENRLSELQAEINRLEKDKKSLLKENNEVFARINSMRKIYDGYGVLEEIGYERYIPTMYGNDIELKIFDIEQKLAKLTANNNLIQYTREYRIDGSATKGKKFQENYGKNLLIGFNTYIGSKEKSVNIGNFYYTCELIEKSFSKYNKQGNLLGISLSGEYLNLRLEMLKMKLELKEKQRREKELLKEGKRRMKEQEKLLAEAEAEKKKLIELRKSMDIAYAKALTDKERKEIKDKIDKMDKRIDDIDYRVNNPKSGWVYIIHSPSLPNMVKIGVSRRLNGPYERVRELSSSSLPENFQLDGFCFSDDAFAIESAMHEYFDNVRVTPNREFFYTTAKEAISVLKNKFNQKVIESEANSDE